MSKTNGFTIWLTGMCRSGKSTIAELLAAKLAAMGRKVELVDDSEYGAIMGGDAASSEESKDDNIRRMIQRHTDMQRQLTLRLGQLAMALTRNDVIAVVAALSPVKEAREENRVKIGRYVEVYVDAPVEVLLKRENDYEVEYARVNKTEISEGRMQRALRREDVMFGINASFDTPAMPEATVDTNSKTADECCAHILKVLCEIGYFRPEEVEAMTGMKVKKFVKPSSEPMVPPKPRGPILLIPKNSPIRAALVNNPGKLPPEVKKALRANAAELKAEQIAARQARLEAMGPSKEEIAAQKAKEAEERKAAAAAEAQRKKEEAEAQKRKEAEALRKKKEAEALKKKKAAEALKKKKEAEALKKKAAAALKKKKEAEAARKKKEAEAARKKKEAEAARKKSSSAKKAPAKAVPGKKNSSKKAPLKAVPGKKSAAKAASKKAPVKIVPAAKKAPAKSPAAKKAVPAKKAAQKAAPAKKAAPSKKAPVKAPSKKAAPAKKAAAAKKAPQKASAAKKPSSAPAKKAAPSKKAPVKASASKKSAPAKKQGKKK